MIAAIVLGAGRSSRLGRTKALLPFAEGGPTFLETVVAALRDGGIETIHVVLGGNAGEIEARIALPAGAAYVPNPDWANGQLSSLLAGLAGLWLLYNMLGGCLAQLRTTTRAGFVEQVEAYVRGALSDGGCSVDACADKLGTSSRTLQKRLTRNGVKFLDIVQNERIKLAKQALLWSEASLDDIAFQLGYSEQTSFGRAFKRATGMTPQGFRSSESRKMQAAAPDKAN